MIALNRRARHDYELLERYEAGIVLNGGEAKAVRTKHINLDSSFAKIIGGEAYLVNANIPVPGKKDYDPTRSRKLLLHKRELYLLLVKTKAKNLTLVPTKVYTKGNLVKVEIALAKSRRKFEKKEIKKARDITRDTERELKN